MLDIKFIRENPDIVKKAAKDKGFKVDVDKVLADDKKRREMILEIENLRSKRNKNSHAKITDAERLELKKIGDDIKKLEDDLKIIEEGLTNGLYALPNISFADVPVGMDDKQNKVIKKVGEPVRTDFIPKDHVEIGQSLDLIDIERGTKVAQSGFYFLKNEGALLEFALINFVIGKLVKKGFIPVITPELVKEKMIVGCGFQPRSTKERQIYHVEGEDLDLIATAEITLVSQHADEVINAQKLPIKYAGFSSCYRTEAGSYGKDVRGIIRVHEFDKIEMVAFCMPDDSAKLHEEFLGIEEEILSDLKIPYQVVLICTGDLGSAAAKKYDLEAWIPTQGKYREVTSTSNTTDFQARRLNIKYKNNNETGILHTLNGTACAIGRTVVAILENYQQADGSVVVPEVLRQYLGKDVIKR